MTPTYVPLVGRSDRVAELFGGALGTEGRDAGGRDALDVLSEVRGPPSSVVVAPGAALLADE
jgi:hypothetical protein